MVSTQGLDGMDDFNLLSPFKEHMDSLNSTTLNDWFDNKKSYN